jgi:predicted O-methyltransferase YrrM
VSSQQEQWARVDEFIAEALLPRDPVLEDALAANRAGGLPRIDVSPAQGRLLNLLVRIRGARTVLELGTLGGYSTIWLARGLPEGGRLVSLEYDPHHAEVARANVARAGLADRVEIRVGAALDALPVLEQQGAGPFDLIFIDADKQTYPAYFEWAMRLTAPGSVIIGDNVVRDGKVADDPPANELAAGARRFQELAGADPRIEATTIQTVGVKGYDGFLIALRTG